MNSKKAREIRKEAKKFSNITGLPYNEVYKQIKKTAKGISMKPKKLD